MKYLIKFLTILNKETFKPKNSFIGYCAEDNSISNVKFLNEFDEWILCTCELQKLAQQYITENDIKNTSADELVAQYGRSKKYNGTTWSLVGGTLPETFKTLADEKYSDFYNKESVELPTGEQLDVPHFWAVINTSMHGFGNAGGWAGDLITYAADVKNGSCTSFPCGSFGMEDWIADSDAYIIYKSYSNDIVNDIQKYYKTKVTESSRKLGFKNDKTILERFNAINGFMEKMAINTLMKNYGVDATDIANAAEKMQNYLEN